MTIDTELPPDGGPAFQQPTPPNSTDEKNRGLNWFFVLSGWVLVIGITGLLYLRWQSPSRSILIGLVGLTPLLVIPYVFAVLSAWLGRSNTLRTVTAALTVGLVYTTSPVDAIVGCRATSAPDEITIYTANVLAGGGRPADVAASILANDPDIVVMQEIMPAFSEVIANDSRLDDYPHRSEAAREGRGGTVIWSRWPISDVTSPRVGGTRFLVNAKIDGPDGAFLMSGVHTTAPAQDWNVANWHEQFQALERIDTDGLPHIIAGDFNATTDHQPMRRLLANGWTTAHEEKGCGFDATWPVDHGLPFAVYRLDHVLVTDDFEVLRVEFADPAGSDHKPVVAAVRLAD